MSECAIVRASERTKTSSPPPTTSRAAQLRAPKLTKSNSNQHNNYIYRNRNCTRKHKQHKRQKPKPKRQLKPTKHAPTETETCKTVATLSCGRLAQTTSPLMSSDHCNRPNLRVVRNANGPRATCQSHRRHRRRRRRCCCCRNRCCFRLRLLVWRRLAPMTPATRAPHPQTLSRIASIITALAPKLSQ